MKFHVLSLFPEYFDTFLKNGVVGGAKKKNLFTLSVTNPRDYTNGNYKMVDDIPYGGGDGMVMAYEPMAKAMRSLPEARSKYLTIYLSPQGKIFNDAMAKELSHTQKEIVFVCGRYAGIDERFVAEFIDLEVSVGDYVVSGGELPALICMDAILRHVPGVLGNAESSIKETFQNDLLEAPAFTRPAVVDGASVPVVLTEGHHEKITTWRRLVSILRTFQRRPDLFLSTKISKKERLKANELLRSMSEKEQKISGLKNQELPLDES
jgi:tRNA (guanine37-N1)-methyltransferase